MTFKKQHGVVFATIFQRHCNIYNQHKPHIDNNARYAYCVIMTIESASGFNSSSLSRDVTYFDDKGSFVFPSLLHAALDLNIL